LCVVEHVGVREVRQNLSVFLRRVRDGETFTVTDHGAPVALLSPLPAVSDDPLADLVALGRVLPGSRRGAALPEPSPAPAAGPSATQELLDERRADRR
jgi:prevent-host-death family protein